MIWQKKEKGSGIMLHLVLGTDWTKNRDTVLGRIAGDVRQKRPNVVLIVPELITHDMERRLCTAAGDTASRYAEVLSFSRLALRVADSMGCAVEECLDNGGRVVAMAAAARMLASKLDLLRVGILEQREVAERILFHIVRVGVNGDIGYIAHPQLVLGIRDIVLHQIRKGGKTMR